MTLYSRPGCHLCEQAKSEISRAESDRDYSFEEVNIEDDPELIRRFGWEIPVVAIDGIVALKNSVTADDFARVLKNVRVHQRF